jgi:1-acyl-sn-glycerol-3-phosphate acyltransferase
MVDAEYLKRVRLATVPRFQQVVGHCVLTPNYRWFATVDIVVEGLEHIPRDRTVLIAMNHTDRFNYWPFQYRLWKAGGYPFTAVWVKGAYYRNPVLALAFRFANAIPVPSMKYLIEERYRSRFGRPVPASAYRDLKDLVDGTPAGEAARGRRDPAVETLVRENAVETLRRQFDDAMAQVAALSLRALREKRLHLIIFPEGTRSTTLGGGRTGLAQLALHSGTPILPVGCNYSDRIYPGNSPFARSGRVVYRVGPPLAVDGALRPWRIREPFDLFSQDSRTRHRERFEAVTLTVMSEINRLLDEPYRTHRPRAL